MQTNLLGLATLAPLSAALLPPFEPVPMDLALILLLNDLAELSSEGLLVLDDYHVITEPRIHETVAFFLDHLPPTLHVLLLSRAKPPLPLLRWHAKGDPCELHTADLRFSREETATFLRQILPTSPSEMLLSQVDRLLEGWVAGLRLLALSWQG